MINKSTLALGAAVAAVRIASPEPVDHIGNFAMLLSTTLGRLYDAYMQKSLMRLAPTRPAGAAVRAHRRN